ncbi:MAG: hypothetical protein HC882_04885 [Acidobacteria bacterium]|nr:hypothetical protein [Acidobacteriota bacterium]
MGWNYEAVDAPADGAARDVTLYDTTIPGFSNLGHTFGDDLTDDERRALIEYLKSL